METSRRRRSWNINKLFGRLDIRTKLAIAFLGLSGVPLALVGWYAAEQHLEGLTEAATQEQRRNLAAMRDRVEWFLRSIEEDLNLLAGSSALRRLVEEAGDSQVVTAQGSAVDARLRAAVESVFRDFLLSKPHYYRLRLLAGGGAELVHVAFYGRIPRVFPPRWRGTGYAYYRTLTQKLQPGEVVFAPVELRAAAPGDSGPPPAGPGPAAGPATLVAALSFVRAVDGEEARVGALLVADIYARSLFELLRPKEPREGEVIALVGPEGHYLFHSAKKTDWNTLLATHQDTLREELPGRVVERVLSGEVGVMSEGLDAVVAFAPLFRSPYPAIESYVLLSMIPNEVVFAPVSSLRRFILVAGTLTLLVAGLLALLAAHQFAAPIRELTRGASRLARGEFDTSLEVETNDEIEDLARTFVSMAQSLAAREQEIIRQREEIRRYAEHLEAMVEERTRELRASQKRLIQQEKMAAVGQLAAGVAHELGTPLATILCHAEMALEEAARGRGERPAATAGQEPAAMAGQEVRESLEAVIEQANRCREIVRSLLDFSRPSTGARTVLSVSELVQRVIRLMEHDMERRGVEIEVALDDGSLQVRGNQNELEQVLVNLIRNAADAMPNGGRIEVSARTEDAGKAGGGPGNPATWVCLQVVDTGTGMDAETQARIFEPFFTTKPPGVGTGLGLWITYNTVTDHGGTIEVESTPGQGTRVSVLLPAVEENA